MFSPHQSLFHQRRSSEVPSVSLTMDPNTIHYDEKETILTAVKHLQQLLRGVQLKCGTSFCFAFNNTSKIDHLRVEEEPELAHNSDTISLAVQSCAVTGRIIQNLQLLSVCKTPRNVQQKGNNNQTHARNNVHHENNVTTQVKNIKKMNNPKTTISTTRKSTSLARKSTLTTDTYAELYERQLHGPSDDSMNTTPLAEEGLCSPVFSPYRNRKIAVKKGLLGRGVILHRGLVGMVRFAGSTSFANGYWLGIELTAPVGKHTGIIDGVKYFTCFQNKSQEEKLNYGLFVRESQVKSWEKEEED